MVGTVDQNRQAELLVDLVQSYDDDVIRGCDCNSMAANSSYRILDQAMTNVVREAWRSPGMACPTGTVRDRFLFHIDLIWLDGAYEVGAVCRVHDRAGSDHRAVLALLSRSCRRYSLQKCTMLSITADL